MAGINRGFSREFSLTTGEDTPVKIPLKAMVDHFLCPICRGTIMQASLTICGHRYCRQCIMEWIGRSHECAVCREGLSQDEIISDKLFDEILETVVKEKKKEEEELYRIAAANTSESVFDSTSHVISPLETVLRKHLKKSLQIHEEYHQQILAECKKSQARAYKDKAFRIDRVIRAYPHDPDHPERLRQMKQIEVDWDVKKQSLEDELIRIQSLLTSTYDKYLERNLPSPSTLPISVTLTVPQKHFIANNIIVKPSDMYFVPHPLPRPLVTIATNRMDDILQKLQRLMKEDKIVILEFPVCEELQISLLSPFAAEKEVGVAGVGLEEEEGVCKPHGLKEGGCGSVRGEEEGLISLVDTTLHGDCRPVMEYGLKSGSEIRVEGRILLEGEQPKVCFAASFIKGQSRLVDYFVCSTCNNTTWICQNCAKVCHKDHELIPHRMNHPSTWACCYCSRKLQCSIFNK